MSYIGSPALIFLFYIKIKFQLIFETKQNCMLKNVTSRSLAKQRERIFNNIVKRQKRRKKKKKLHTEQFAGFITPE